MHAFETLSAHRFALAPPIGPDPAAFTARAEGSERCDTPWAELLPWQARRVREYIDAHLHGRISLSDAAGHARLSPGYFSRCFRRSFGVTFTRFVAARRVERAQGFMVEDAGKLCQIALACGFADQAHFTRTFGALMGCTPARWRRDAITARVQAAVRNAVCLSR